jgi:hypothetical protein
MKRAIPFTLGCLIAAALGHGTVRAQVGGRAAFEQQLFNQRQQLFNNQVHWYNNQVNAYNSLTNGRNPYINSNNQLQMAQGAMQQGSLYQGSWQSQALMNGLAAQTYGTNYGIPFNYSTVANYYSPSNYPSAYPSYAPTANPYASGGYGYGTGMANPYAPTAPGYGVGANPYSPNGGDPSNPYNPNNPSNPFNNPYATAGQTLVGSADVMKAYGQVINAQEDARIKRELALQQQLVTKQKKFELDMYIKANTPTYTQEQEFAARNQLRRIQTNSLPGEVQNGKSLNFLLKDLSKYGNKLGEGKIPLEPLPLSEAALNHLNVTKNNYGMGLLRDDGRITWPPAIQIPVNQKKELEAQIKGLVKDAYKGKIDANVLKDVRNEMERLKEELLKKVNDIPSNQYMDAKRFLQEFDQASIALERGEAPVQAKFQRFVEGGRSGRSVQELAEYMFKEGLRFGPATADDEAAYRAVHAAMATYDVAMNAQLGVDAKDQ